MQDQWYADNRDLVKWGVLLALAERHDIRHIPQVLYYRHSTWADLDLDGEQVPLPDAVIRHFRQVASVSAIKSPAPIEVISEPFESRTDYHKLVVARMNTRPEVPGIIFLDPNTGLEPGTPTLKHVLRSEVAALWAALRNGDLLVFYQHQTNRSGKPWIGPKKRQFERAIRVPAGASKVAQSKKIARDVVFFYARKGS